MEDQKLEKLIQAQRKPSSPMYLARKFDDWTDRTGILSGAWLTWILRLPAGLIAIIVSLIYWGFIGRKSQEGHLIKE